MKSFTRRLSMCYVPSNTKVDPPQRMKKLKLIDPVDPPDKAKRYRALGGK